MVGRYMNQQTVYPLDLYYLAPENHNAEITLNFVSNST